MRIHVLQHVSFEDPGHILTWAHDRGHTVTGSRLWESPVMPSCGEVDLLLIMGGPMSANDERIYPWLTGEKHYVSKTIGAGKTVVGICLGAQLIASVLGARVYQNPHREIGFYPVKLHHGKQYQTDRLFPGFGDTFEAFHWHGETFDLPAGARLLASTQGCAHQAFASGDRVIGLQFHLECCRTGIEELLSRCAEEMSPGPFVQSPEIIRKGYFRLSDCHLRCEVFLDALINGPKEGKGA